jgi:hypothetical protein
MAVAPPFDHAGFRISAGVVDACADGAAAFLAGCNSSVGIVRIVAPPRRA